MLCGGFFWETINEIEFDEGANSILIRYNLFIHTGLAGESRLTK